MPSQATVTAKIGAGSTLTATVFTNVTFYSVDTIAKVLTVVANGITTQMDINAATVFTTTIAGGNYTLVVS